MEEKYKELFELSLKVLEEEQQRTNRLDEKASKYFSVLTFLIGIYGVFCSRIISECVPFKGWMDVSLIGLGFLNLLGLIAAWFLCFAVFRQHVIVKIPFNDEVIRFYKDNELIDIHYTLSKANKDALVENRSITDKKSYLLVWTYKILSWVFVLMIVMMFIFGVNIWTTKNNLKSGGVAMVEESKSKEKPDENIKPPTYDRITEGYDPSKTKKIEKGVVEKGEENK